MNGLTYAQSLILGIVQGLTEFLPVSSSGHLAITQMLMGLDADSHAMLMFDVATHVGTALAVIIVFAGTFVAFGKRLLRESASGYAGKRTAWGIALKGAAATVLTAGIGLGLKDWFEAKFEQPGWIGAGLLITGTLLFIIGRIPRPRRGWRRFGMGRAIVVGFAQACAILPGVSRSGATICSAMLLGLRRRWAAEFSFFIAIPAIGGAALIKTKDMLDLPAAELAALPKGPILVGSAAALVSGFFALRLLLAAVRRARLQYFSYYCWMVGLAVLLALRSY